MSRSILRPALVQRGDVCRGSPPTWVLTLALPSIWGRSLQPSLASMCPPIEREQGAPGRHLIDQVPPASDAVLSSVSSTASKSTLGTELLTSVLQTVSYPNVQRWPLKDEERKRKEGSGRRTLGFSPQKHEANEARLWPPKQQARAPTPASSVSQAGTRNQGTESTVPSPRETCRPQGFIYKKQKAPRRIPLVPQTDLGLDLSTLRL